MMCMTKLNIVKSLKKNHDYEYAQFILNHKNNFIKKWKQFRLCCGMCTINIHTPYKYHMESGILRPHRKDISFLVIRKTLNF